MDKEKERLWKLYEAYFERFGENFGRFEPYDPDERTDEEIILECLRTGKPRQAPYIPPGCIA